MSHCIKQGGHYYKTSTSTCGSSESLQIFPQRFHSSVQIDSDSSCRESSSGVIMMFKSILLLSIIGFCSAQTARPRSGGICSSPADCPSGECCVIPSQRYTYPTCQRVRQVGEVCRPRPEVESSTLRYPDGSTFKYTDAHRFVCPCAAGLECSGVDASGLSTCSAPRSN
ncbi:astakine-like isoform X2 [Diachasmimorpha longicaudata]|uniref:astakine-like isoform X2 n=1 Tax=Diachasmimorpha longicaudata TaxID=58733 RepID=UPI0030B88647